jgi:acetyltransferase-like isoleucine patch superfamily enzyme
LATRPLSPSLACASAKSTGKPRTATDESPPTSARWHGGKPRGPSDVLWVKNCGPRRPLTANPYSCTLVCYSASMSLLRRGASEALALVSFHRDPVAYFRRQGARIGQNVHIYGGNRWTLGSEPYLVTIEDNVTISHDVSFITHDGGLQVIWDLHPEADYFAPIIVGACAFIGARVILLPGVTVGSMSVVGAGAVVSRDIPARVVAVGSPARPIRSVDDYAAARRDEWTNTAGLSTREKEKVLREKYLPRRNSEGSKE